MKSFKKHTIIVVCFTALFITFKANAQTTNFSGTWQIDTTRTKFNGAPTFVLPKALRVSQTTAGLMIDRTSQDAKHYIQQIALDGKSSQTITASGNSETDSLNWSATPILNISAKSPNGDPLLSATETWSLADNGKTLIIDRQVGQANGMKFEIKGYYNKM